MYRKRLKGYASIGYKTIIKGSPTLFDDVNDIDFSINEGQIFNGKTYFRPYKTDLGTAKHSIVLSSPKLYKVERNDLVEHLMNLSSQGIEVLVLTQTANEQAEYLQRKGLSVKIIPTLSLCTTIIDKSVVWYGAINALGYTSEEDNVIKVTDKNLADELTNALLSCNSA